MILKDKTQTEISKIQEINEDLQVFANMDQNDRPFEQVVKLFTQAADFFLPEYKSEGDYKMAMKNLRLMNGMALGLSNGAGPDRELAKELVEICTKKSKLLPSEEAEDGIGYYVSKIGQGLTAYVFTGVSTETKTTMVSPGRKKIKIDY